MAADIALEMHVVMMMPGISAVLLAKAIDSKPVIAWYSVQQTFFNK
jgi:hypothetical protein